MIPLSSGGVDPSAIEAAALLLREALRPVPPAGWPLWTGPAARAAGWAFDAAATEQRRLRAVLSDAADALTALAASLRRVTDLELTADRVLVDGAMSADQVATAERLRRDARTEAEDADRCCSARLRGLPWGGVSDPETALVARFAARGWSGVAPSDRGLLAALQPEAVAGDLAAPRAARLIAAPLVLARAGVDTAGRSWLFAGDGRVAEVWGDVTAAEHVLVFVPGTGTSVQSWGKTAGHGDTMWEALCAKTGGDGAVVAWLGAPEPPNLGAAALQHWAEDAAPVLGSFLQDLPVAAGAHVTLVGHSYGAVVAGLAVHQGARPDALVGVAPAGFGPQVHGTGDLGGVPTYVLEDTRDPIRIVPYVQTVVDLLADSVVPYSGPVVDRVSGELGIGHLGDDPVCLPGTVELASADDNPWSLPVELSRHSSYFDPGSETVEQIAAVAAGTAVVTAGARCAVRRRSGR